MRLNVEQMEHLVWQVGGNQTDPGLRRLRLDLVVDAFEHFMENGSGFAYGEPGGFLLAMHSIDVFSGSEKHMSFCSWWMNTNNRTRRLDCWQNLKRAQKQMAAKQPSLVLTQVSQTGKKLSGITE